MARKKPESSLGPTTQVTYRIPTPLYKKLLAIAESIYQPMPVVLRMAAAEYAKNHRPVRHPRTGISLKWPPDLTDGKDGEQWAQGVPEGPDPPVPELTMTLEEVETEKKEEGIEDGEES